MGRDYERFNFRKISNSCIAGKFGRFECRFGSEQEWRNRFTKFGKSTWFREGSFLYESVENVFYPKDEGAFIGFWKRNL